MSMQMPVEPNIIEGVEQEDTSQSLVSYSSFSQSTTGSNNKVVNTGMMNKYLHGGDARAIFDVVRDPEVTNTCKTSLKRLKRLKF